MGDGVSDEDREIWLPTSEMSVTVDAAGNVTLIENMTMTLGKVRKPAGFVPPPPEPK